jgi:hypothetical protein
VAHFDGATLRAFSGLARAEPSLGFTKKALSGVGGFAGIFFAFPMEKTAYSVFLGYSPFFLDST